MLPMCCKVKGLNSDSLSSACAVLLGIQLNDMHDDVEATHPYRLLCPNHACAHGMES